MSTMTNSRMAEEEEKEEEEVLELHLSKTDYLLPVIF